MSSLEFTHRRKNPLTGDWVLVSPHRNNRPWSGATEADAVEQLPSYDENCPLCPGNERANDTSNPEYQDTFVFVNDFGALVSDNDNQVNQESPSFIQADVARGECRVICFSPDHSKTLPELSNSEIEAVIETWQSNYNELSKQYDCVHVFENKGAIMGCSQPHPHGQIWAHDHMSTEIEVENEHLAAYKKSENSNLFADYINFENEQKERVVYSNEHWLAVVPYWAAWPFETLLIAKDDVRHMGQLNAEQKASLGDALKQLTTKYDNVFNCSFPYSMGWHSAPSSLDDDSHWRLHAHFYPPLLRSATVKKHMVGYEMLAESQRDLTAETAANILQEASSTHYKKGL
ncbi:UDP-glucose--hexose-1-phosphate uridylyltransferase [Thalassotalea crassostreae]|uniref:UDP-glucose--hexose-1-phosphate uridylyltransferase n=1 Tax=Thalassotalea crassostreae TaxID=1763536 RepID=UPI0008383FFA|nr:UDP-glucose--hexose-1-phosphate uridylyltransferase [Thalassotalea crassostreae]